MPSDIDDDPPASHAIADDWAEFSETVLPTIGGADHAQVHIALRVSQECGFVHNTRLIAAHGACRQRASRGHVHGNETGTSIGVRP